MSTNPEKTTFGATVERVPSSSTAMPDEKTFQFPSQQQPSKNNTTTTTFTTTSFDKETSTTHAHQLSSRPATSDTMGPLPDRDPSNPFSAFYEHPAARRSAEVPRSQLLQPPTFAYKTPAFAYSDVESGGALGLSASAATTQTNLSSMPKISIEHSKECAMWPSRETLLKQRQEEAKRNRGRCDCWGRLTKKQRLILQILLAFLVVGAAVGVGVGISRAVGGGVWAGSGTTKQVPTDKDD